MANPSLDQIAVALQRANAAIERGDPNASPDEARQLAAAYKQMQSQQAVPTQATSNTGTVPRTKDPADIAADQAAAANTNDGGVSKMNLLDEITNAMGVTVSKWGEGAQELWGKATNNPALVNRVIQQQQKDAPYRNALADTLGGKIGDIGMNTVGASLPIAGMEMGGTGLAGAGLARPLARALMNPSVQGAVAGTAQGALTPTSNANQSQLENAAQGGAWGAAAPAILKYGPALAARFMPGVGAKVGPIAKAAMLKFLGPSDAAVASAADASAQQIGQRMGAITDNLSVPISKDAADTLAATQRAYGSQMTDATNNALDQAILAGRNNGSAAGSDIAKFRSNALKNAAATSGDVTTGYNDIQRVLDNQIDTHLNSLPPSTSELRFGQTKAQQLRLLRAAYATAKGGTPVNPAGILSKDIAAAIPQNGYGVLPLAATVAGEQQFLQSN
jgi:hypothetical protein